MATYSKKPGTVEAWQLGGGFPHPIWLANAVTSGVVVLTEVDGTETAVVQTTQGTVNAVAHSFLIRNDLGEIYPCRADIFVTNYDLVV